MNTTLPALPPITNADDSEALSASRQALSIALAVLDLARRAAEDDRIVEALDIAAALLDEQMGELYCLAHTIHDDEAEARAEARGAWFTPYYSAA